jgi:tRNA modification GTPase
VEKVMNKRSDTIAAISTSLGKSGIGIVRVSGSHALSIISPFIQSKIPLSSLSNLNTRKLLHCFLMDNAGNKIDEILLSIMPPGKSFTGELTLEINCHGGLAAVTSALELVLDNGARLAEPGEFTKRACINGRIDLVQAEAINQIINASSLNALKMAWRQFDGGLTGKCDKLRKETIEVLGQIQYLIDFEDNQDDQEAQGIKDKIRLLKSDIEQMMAFSEKASTLNRAIWVSIYGHPNVGKSSLFNALLSMQRAIVCDTPGTTRDHISENIIIKGFEVRLTDTAGLRETGDKIEAESIRRSLDQISAADIKLYVLDGSKDMQPDQELEISKVLEGKGLVVLNKSDLEKSSSFKKLGNKVINDQNFLEVSIQTGKNLDILEKRLEETIISGFSDNQESIMLTMRQKTLLGKCLENITNVLSLDKSTLDVYSFELQEFVNNVDKITGSITNEEVLDNIFNNFCVGK